MTLFSRSLFFALPVLLGHAADAQCTVDIRLVPGQNNDLEVRIRPTENFDGVFAGSVFTIRWSDASGANLGALAQDPGVQYYHDVNKSGPEQVDGEFRYQIFAGFGFTALSDIPDVLVADAEVILCTIPVLNAQTGFNIVNDAWTTANNGDFFISLNGAESTGIIDESTSIQQGTIAADVFLVHPSLVVDLATVEMDMGNTEYLDLTLVNAVGQEVWTRKLGGAHGRMRQTVDMLAMDAGLYLLQLRTSEGARVLRVVKK